MEALTARLLADTERELERMSASDSDDLLRRFLLLSLEREQVAAIAYSEDLLIHRLTEFDVSPEIAELLRRVILWVQRDEELHAQYLRGLLVRTQTSIPTAFVFMRQLFGGVSGWVSAMRHHRPPGRFGVRNMLAAAALGGGRLLGRIPDGLERELRYTSFRHYCEVNVALELSAVVSYEYVLPLLSDETEIEAFTRMLADEVRHAEVFEVLVEAFDENDLLRPGVDLAWLIDRLGAISPWFLPGDLRPDRSSGSLGVGSPVHVASGPMDPIAALDEAITETGLEAIVRADPRSVVIQAAFMLGYNRDDQSSVLHPAFVDHLAMRLREWGAEDVVLLEMPNVYDRFYGNRSVHEVAEYFGFGSPHYRIVDGSTDQVHVEFDRGLVASSMARAWHDASIRIVFSRLMGDPSEIAHACMATLCNIGERTDERLFTNKMIDHRTAGLMALDVAPPHFALIDAWAPVADGALGVMGSATPSDLCRIYAGVDPLSVDAALFADLGFDDPHFAEIHRQADAWFGRRSGPVQVTGSPGPIEGYRTPTQGLWTRFVSATANPIYFHLSGNGRWFTPAFDTDAFPEIDDPSLAVRTCRRVARRVFGLHPPVA